MPVTRSSMSPVKQVKFQRLSDFFPNDQAPSPIHPPTKYVDLVQPIRVEDDLRTPAKRRKSSTRPATPRISTPKFDPEVHGVELDHSDESEDAFVNSITFSRPASVRSQKPVGELVVDYDSDEDSFSFSAIKTKSPIKVRLNPGLTPSRPPAMRKVIWNSSKKRVQDSTAALSTEQVKKADRSSGSAKSGTTLARDRHSSALGRQSKSLPQAMVANEPTRRIAPSAVSSPRVQLTRSVSGSVPVHTLERLEVPAAILQVKPRTQAPKPFARLPDKARVSSATVKSQNKRGSSVAQNQRKRKADDDADEVGLASPAKRLRLSGSRKIAPLRPSKRVVSERGQSQQNVMSRPRKVIATSSLTRKLPSPGVVPGTLYSPERQTNLARQLSPTQPQPFTFATEKRSHVPRSDFTSPQKKALPKPAKLARIPALTVRPFVPRPSEQPCTTAASPQRTLPSRLELRRDFDKIAETHAAQMLARRKEQESALAAERERRIEERKTWRASGMEAVEQWQCSNQGGQTDKRRGWID